MDGFKQGSFYLKKVAAALSLIFFVNSVIPSPAFAQAAMQTILPASTSIGVPAGSYVPVHIKALKVRVNEPLVFDFIIDSGSTGTQGEALKAETQKLAKYFLAAMTIPESDLWVNLSPYESDRIIPNELGVTEMGREMLAQDRLLKQMSSAIVNPDTELGQIFWQKVYAKAREVLGTTELPLDTMQKIWIIPSEARIYEMNNTALLGESTLKVMLDQDYYALGLKEKPLDNEMNTIDARQAREVSLQAMRDIILPAVEKEVNEGKDFASLRQLYGAMIFATWYKKALKESLLSKVYADQKKTAGVESGEASARERIYQEYLTAFKEGAFNFIREDADPVTGDIIPRKYFSGGVQFDDMAQKVKVSRVQTGRDIPAAARNLSVDGAMLTSATIALTKPDMAQKIERSKVSDMPKNVFERTVSYVVPSESLTDQSIPSFVYNLMGVLKNKKLMLLKKEIAEGITYSKKGEELSIFFDDRTSLTLTFSGKQISFSTEHLFAADEVSGIETLLMDMLTGDDHFANTGYSEKVSLNRIRAIIAGGKMTSKYQKELNVAWQAVGAKGLKPELFLVPGNTEVFGIAYVDGKIFIEEALLDRIKGEGNPFNMLTRAFIFALSSGDWVGKKQKEFEWARKTFNLEQSSSLKDLIELEKALEQEINYGLLKESAFSDSDKEQMKIVFDDIKLRVQQFLAVVGVAQMNGEVKEGKYNFYPLAADPFHWGQFEALLRLMMTTKALNSSFRLQGPDFRKLLTVFTKPHRENMLGTFVDRPEFAGYFAMPNSLIGSVDGETALIDFLLEHADDEQAVEVNYLVGTDHMHKKVPSKKIWIDGLFLPKKITKVVDGQEVELDQPDTIEKNTTLLIEKLVAMQKKLLEDGNDPEKLRKVGTVLSRLEKGTMKVVSAFNERSPFDSIPTSGEQDVVREELKKGTIKKVLGSNILMGLASATAIRNALIGIGDFWALALLPTSIMEEIQRNDEYRGWAIKFPDAVRRLALAVEGDRDPKDVKLVSNWLKQVNKNRGKGYSIDEISRMFTLNEKDLNEARKLKEEDPNFNFEEETAILTPETIRKALRGIDFSMETTGGIDLNAALLDMKVEKSGSGVKVTVDPKLIEQIKMQGVDGFMPVIINMMPVTSVLPTMGLSEAPQGAKAVTAG